MLSIHVSDAYSEIGHITIRNDGTGTSERGNYDVSFHPAAKESNGTNVQGIAILARIEDYDRSKKGWMPLLRQALAAMEPMAKVLLSFNLDSNLLESSKEKE